MLGAYRDVVLFAVRTQRQTNDAIVSSHLQRFAASSLRRRLKPTLLKGVRSLA